MSKNRFGCYVEESVYLDQRVEKVVKAPLLPFEMDYVQQEAHLRDSIERHAEKV